MMVHVAETGPHYAEETLIPGYVVGGKTGTAQIWDPESHSWLENTYNHTFVGFVGAERPEAVILVRIHDTEPDVQQPLGARAADDDEPAVQAGRPVGDRVTRHRAIAGHASGTARPRGFARPTGLARVDTRPDTRPAGRPAGAGRVQPTSTAARGAMREWPAVADPSVSSVFDAPSLASAIGGRILSEGRDAIRGARRRLTSRGAGQRLLRAAGRAHRRPSLRGRCGSKRRGRGGRELRPAVE